MAIEDFVHASDMTATLTSGPQRAVYLEMVYRSDRTGIVRISLTEIATITRFSIATVKREVARLSQMGLLRREAHGRYLVDLPKLPVIETIDQRTRSWVERQYGRAFAEDGRRIVVLPQNLPDFLDEAVEDGVMLLERDNIRTPAGIAKQFSLHFYRRRPDDRGKDD
ncbi:MAG: hypothetical protein O3B84_05865 [Chloroflexi bacterium]|nr:hypothetical protein [Chloroflexota bacterium]